MKRNKVDLYWKRMSRLGRQILSFTDILSELDIKEVLSIMYSDRYITVVFNILDSVIYAYIFLNIMKLCIFLQTLLSFTNSRTESCFWDLEILFVQQSQIIYSYVLTFSFFLASQIIFALNDYHYGMFELLYFILIFFSFYLFSLI